LIAATDPSASCRLRELDIALAQLRQEERQVVLLVGLEGLRYDETAQTLRVPLGTVASRLSSGRDQLRRLMDMTSKDGAFSGAAPSHKRSDINAPPPAGFSAPPRRLIRFDLCPWVQDVMRADFVRKLAMRMLAGEGIMGIWELQVAAANAHRRGQSAVAVMLTEIVDAAEQEWRLAVDSRLTSTWIG
jgi:hypothetical protein